MKVDPPGQDHQGIVKAQLRNARLTVTETTKML